ncbi:MAG: cation-transporting P-type ATPase, partial [Gemmatimonadota bacterium]|nr:cation-transporting P-type ATPase [Gemmatimonadota bacterium]
MAETTQTATTSHAPWFTLEADAVVAALGSDARDGLTAAEAASRLAAHGPNAIAAEPAPSVWQLALKQLVDPMNIMLVAVTVISLIIDQIPVGIMVGFLVVLNVVMGTRQELKAKASVDALANMQIPHARVVRDGTLLQIPATELVPGDIVNLEAGDLVPADGRILRSATLETQEAALTGESAPIAKDPAALADP